MKKKYFSLLALLAIIPAVMFGTHEEAPNYNDGKITTITSGLIANISEQERMEKSDIVLKGKILDVQQEIGHLDADRGIVKIYSVYTVEPLKVFKGEAKDKLTVKVLGGETDDYRTISDNMLLDKNSQVYMSLTLSDDGSYYNVFAGSSTTYVIDGNTAKNSIHHQVAETDLDRNLVSLSQRTK